MSSTLSRLSLSPSDFKEAIKRDLSAAVTLVFAFSKILP